MKFNSLAEIVEQLEMPDYKTQDGIHNLKDNAAFIQLKELKTPNIINYNNIIEDLKDISNKYMVCNQSYVIPKSVLDIYIDYLDNIKNA